MCMTKFKKIINLFCLSFLSFSFGCKQSENTSADTLLTNAGKISESYSSSQNNEDYKTMSLSFCLIRTDYSLPSYNDAGQKEEDKSTSYMRQFPSAFVLTSLDSFNLLGQNEYEEFLKRDKFFLSEKVDFLKENLLLCSISIPHYKHDLSIQGITLGFSNLTVDIDYGSWNFESEEYPGTDASQLRKINFCIYIEKNEIHPLFLVYPLFRSFELQWL